MESGSEFRIDRRFVVVYFGILLTICAIPWTITAAIFVLAGGGVHAVWLWIVWTADDLGSLALLSIVPCVAIWLKLGSRLLKTGRTTHSAAQWTGASMATSGTVVFTIQRGFTEGDLPVYNESISFEALGLVLLEIGSPLLLPFALFSSWLMVRRLFGGDVTNAKT